jgi:hypothetical protein
MIALMIALSKRLQRRVDERLLTGYHIEHGK